MSDNFHNDQAAIRNLIADAEKQIERLQIGCLGELSDRVDDVYGDCVTMLAELIDSQLYGALRALSALRYSLSDALAAQSSQIDHDVQSTVP
ncbi:MULTISPECIES: hypothetical protein [Mycolicibacterium]|jgi:hypothetical protein|uniref:Uncharacterized protein n=1 Tax=Mycolicibacterium chlorophenolicum TaxID=37916 RepID=A0A0J6W9L3_9MYCO|nr:hypothetical protein [Mycolicibacterium chlorophenolicum]KMO79885.1 hypothetical protein MCHLDSM_01769 [Mycolicibacterium chlorophenolicum]